MVTILFSCRDGCGGFGLCGSRGVDSGGDCEGIALGGGSWGGAGRDFSSSFVSILSQVSIVDQLVGVSVLYQQIVAVDCGAVCEEGLWQGRGTFVRIGFAEGKGETGRVLEEIDCRTICIILAPSLLPSHDV